MKVIKILIAVLCFLALLAGLFILLIYSMRYRPEKTETINISYSKKPPYLLAKKPYYTATIWDIGSAVSGMGSAVFFEGGSSSRPERDSVTAYFSGIKEYLSTLSDVDFLLLQEIDQKAKRSYKINQIQSIDSLFPNSAICFAKNQDLLSYPLPFFKPYGRIVSGMETLSSTFPMESVRFAFEKKGTFFEKLFAQNDCCIINNYRMRNGRSLIVINIHNGTFALGDVDASQLGFFLSLMVTEYEQGNYVLAGGNWNVNPTDFSDTLFTTGDVGVSSLSKLPAGIFPIGWKQNYDVSAPSCRKRNAPYKKGETPTTTTDFFITSPNIQVVETKIDTLNFRYANHQPISIKFMLK